MELRIFLIAVSTQMLLLRSLVSIPRRGCIFVAKYLCILEKPRRGDIYFSASIYKTMILTTIHPAKSLNPVNPGSDYKPLHTTPL